MNDEKTMVGGDGPAAPKMLLGPYETMEILGRGGMAVVYKGMQQSLGRIVAIKVLPKEFSRDRQFVGRFHREAESVAKLNHPNIIQIIDKGEDKGTCYFVMEYVKGMSLAARLANKGCSFKELVEIGLQVAGALHYAHENGVVHRDIKPANILLDDATGIAKVADFGIAQLAEKSTAIGTLTGDHMAMGTLDYMAPEQKRDAKNVDRRADIYSLGVMMYEMSTGRVPMGIFDPPTRINKELPRDFDTIVMKCLRDKPDERFQSCLELSNALMALPQSPSTMVRMMTSVRSGVTNIGTQIGRRNPRYIAAILFLVIGIGAGSWAVAKYAKERPGSGGAIAGSGGEKKPADDSSKPPVDPVDPVKPPVDGDVEAVLADVIAKRLAGDYEGALFLLAKLEKDHPETKSKVVIARDQVTQAQADALDETYSDKLTALVGPTGTPDPTQVAPLKNLLEEATSKGVRKNVLADIRRELRSAQEAADTLAADTLAKDKRKQFERVIAEVRAAIAGSDWATARARLNDAQTFSSGGTDTQAIEALNLELTEKQLAASSSDQKKKEFEDTLVEARRKMKAGQYDQARTLLQSALVMAGADETSKEQVKTLRKQTDEAEKEALFILAMERAKAREESMPDEALRLYKDALNLASDGDRKTVETRIRDLEAKIVATEKAEKVARFLASARKARDLGNWKDALNGALDALQLDTQNQEALAIKDEAQKKLKATPVDPPVDPPATGYRLKFKETLPLKVTSGGSMALGPDGTLYILDTTSKQVLKLDGDLKQTGALTIAVKTPDRMIMGPDGKLWISDSAANQIARVDPATGKSESVIGAPGTGPAKFKGIGQMAVLGACIVAVDPGNTRLQRLDLEGVCVSTMGSVVDGREPETGEFSRMAGLAIDDEGRVYAGDFRMKRIMRFNANGSFDRIWTPTPTWLAGDMCWSKNRIYVSDTYLKRLLVFTEDGAQITAYGKAGKLAEDFGIPGAIQPLKNGKILVYDTYYRRIQVLEESE